MNVKPNYYGILPASVRYAKIKPMCKIMYTELTALSNKNGYCHASNQYFAELYDVHKNTVSLWINELEKNGFINIVINTNEKGYTRKIYVTPYQQKAEGVSTKSCRGYQQKAEDNITSINNTRVIKQEQEEELKETSKLKEQEEYNNSNTNTTLKKQKEKKEEISKLKEQDYYNTSKLDIRYKSVLRIFREIYNRYFKLQNIPLVSEAGEKNEFIDSYKRATKDNRLWQFEQDEVQKRVLNYYNSDAEPYKTKSFKQFIRHIHKWTEPQKDWKAKQENGELDIYAGMKEY